MLVAALPILLRGCAESVRNDMVLLGETVAVFVDQPVSALRALSGAGADVSYPPGFFIAAGFNITQVLAYGVTDLKRAA